MPAGVRLDDDDLAAAVYSQLTLTGQGRCKPDIQAVADPVEDVSQAPLRFDEFRCGRRVSLFEDEANDPERHAFGKIEDLGAHVAPPSRGEPGVHRSQKRAGIVQQVRLRERGLGGFELAGFPLPARAEQAVPCDGTFGFVQTVEVEHGVVERPPIGVTRRIPLEFPGETD